MQSQYRGHRQGTDSKGNRRSGGRNGGKRRQKPAANAHAQQGQRSRCLFSPRPSGQKFVPRQYEAHAGKHPQPVFAAGRGGFAAANGMRLRGCHRRRACLPRQGRYFVLRRLPQFPHHSGAMHQKQRPQRLCQRAIPHRKPYLFGLYRAPLQNGHSGKSSAAIAGSKQNYGTAGGGLRALFRNDGRSAPRQAQLLSHLLYRRNPPKFRNRSIAA